MKMYQLIEWFQIHFPTIHKDLLACKHNYDDKFFNPYHLESDCWSHTMMVCKIAELSEYDTVVQVAALLHDIGKPASREINPDNNHVQFSGHEVLSVTMAEDVLKKMIEEKMISMAEKKEIIKLTEHHSFLYKHNESNKMMQYFNGDKKFGKHLVELMRCDSLGRFSPSLPSEEYFQKLFDMIEAF